MLAHASTHMRIDDSTVREITFDRPDVRNAMTAAVDRELADALTDRDPADHDAVVTDNGEAFSAGSDIEAMTELDKTTLKAYECVLTIPGRIAENALSASPYRDGGQRRHRRYQDVTGYGVGFRLRRRICPIWRVVHQRRPRLRYGATAILPRLIGLRKTKELALPGSSSTRATPPS